MGNGAGTLTAAEQQALDALLARCARPGASRHDLESCAIYKSAAAARKDAEVANGQAASALAAAGLQQQRLLAVSLVTQRMSALQNQGLLLLSALMVAAREYDLILSVHARKPVMGDILLGLTISFLPELAAMSKTFKVLGLGRNETPLLAVGLDRIGVQQQNGRTFAQYLAERLDARSNNIVKSIRDPINARNGLDGASVQKFQAYQAMNKMMSEALTALNTRLWQAGIAEGVLIQFCAWASDPYTAIGPALAAAGLEVDESAAVPFDKLESLLLYDALRLYVRSYFVVHGEFDDTADGLGQSHPEDWIDGLNSAQREMIYDRFRRVPWTDTGRPPVDGYRDLLRLWNGRFVADVQPTGPRDSAILF